MRVHKREAAILRRALADWREKGLLDPATAGTLENSLSVIAFDWKRLGKYAFLVSLLCLIIAIGALTADEQLRRLLGFLFNAPRWLQCLGLSGLAVAIFALGLKRRRRHPEKRYSNESIFFLGVLAVAGAVSVLGLAMGRKSDHYSLLLLLSCGIYGALGCWFRSGLIWLFALLSLGGWLGAETGYLSGWGTYYLGMNYPLRFTVFGGLLTAAGLLLRRGGPLGFVQHTTLVMGLLYLFISLWILSIFGNHGDTDTWLAVRQYRLLPWALLFALVAGWAIYYGLRHDNAMVKGFGLTFLLINLYTRFFEYFWEPLNKIIFFVLLAASFWGLGQVAERLWNLGEKEEEDTPVT